MCGICGFIVEDQVGTTNWGQILDNMTRILTHRGPDSHGHYYQKTSNLIIGLGHRRLSIIDLSKQGNQPMANEKNDVFIVFNGEIYNYRELTDQLIHRGHLFRSRSDTEVIVHLYEDLGERCIDKLDGMFAFAIWDEHRRQLFLARDRVGVKPLFYAPLAKGLAFASEIKALFFHPALRQKMESEAVDAYLALGYVPGPGTIFQGIRSLMPGHWLKWQEGHLKIGRYWAPDFGQPVFEGSEDNLAQELDIRLNDAVKSHLVADVPVGAFLSGGIDSSLVAAITQRHSAEPIHTFNVGFSGGGDERTFARTVATHIRSNHHESLVEPDLIQQLPRLIGHLEQPLFDNSVLPTFLVSQFAREKVKVVLSGDGGDEPFAGYDWTRLALALPNLPIKWRPAGWQWGYQSGLVGLVKKLVHDIGRNGDARYLRRITVSRALRHWLYTPEFLEQLYYDPLEDLEKILRMAPVRDERERFLYADLCAYLPEDVLFKVDRMSMANSLEVRVPLLDHRLLEWLFRLPFSMRYCRGHGKYLLRKVAERYVPPAILRPRKQGFTVPMGRWLHGKLGDLVEALFTSNAFVQRGIVRPRAALELLDMHRSKQYNLGHRIWSLVILEVWARVWLDGQDAGQGLLALLMETEDWKSFKEKCDTG